MTSLRQQMEQLKQQQQELEERIKKEEETKQKLENESSIDRLEALVQPLTDVLERKDNHGTQIHPQWGKTKREQHNIQYNIDMQKFNKRLGRFDNPHNPPQKNKNLLEEEIYTTIISILKKQEREMEKINCKLDKYINEYEKWFAYTFANNPLSLPQDDIWRKAH